MIFNGQKRLGCKCFGFWMPFEIRKLNHLKSGQKCLFFWIVWFSNGWDYYYSYSRIIWTPHHLKSDLQKVRISKLPDFKSFRISNGLIPYPHCSIFLKWWKQVQFAKGQIFEWHLKTRPFSLFFKWQNDLLPFEKWTQLSGVQTMAQILDQKCTNKQKNWTTVSSFSMAYQLHSIWPFKNFDFKINLVSESLVIWIPAVYQLHLFFRHFVVYFNQRMAVV